MVWMIWVLGRATGTNTVIQTLILLLGLGLVAWAFGHWQKSSFGIKGFSGTLVLAAVAVFFGRAQVTPDAPTVKASAAATDTTKDGIAWLPFSPEAVQTKLKAGQPVFVDFTADWCITCKVNERTIIETEEVISVMKSLMLLPLKVITPSPTTL